MPQTQPTCSTRSIVEAMPATLEEDDPFLGVGLLAQIETCMSSIIAEDTRVCQLNTLQGSIVIVFGITNSWMHHNIFALN